MDARQGTTLFSAVCAFIGTLVVIQLWLVAASLEALFSDETAVLFPAALASFALFLINGRLFFLVIHFDRRLRKATQHDGGQT
jgi:hypothetical protein